MRKDMELGVHFRSIYCVPVKSVRPWGFNGFSPCCPGIFTQTGRQMKQVTVNGMNIMKREWDAWSRW